MNPSLLSDERVKDRETRSAQVVIKAIKATGLPLDQGSRGRSHNLGGTGNVIFLFIF